MQRGFDILRDPRLNKSTAFTNDERDRFGLHGLLPPAICTQKVQVQRAVENMRRKAYDIERFIYLQALQGRNERLFFRLIMDHLEEVMPLVYTPTVGQACQEFANIFRQTKGLYVSAQERGRVREIVRNWPESDVSVVVVTDGERILGLGDLGANGMGIPIGKLSLYTALAGVPPEQTLPIMLDVGTANLALRNDPLYLGLNQDRLRGNDYLALVDELIEALTEAFPHCLIQFEDFATPNAYALLNRYHKRCLCFNDDIQGTAAVALAGLYAATRIIGPDFADLRIMFLGAGSAATGIGDLVFAALREAGLDEQSARERLCFVDHEGLVVNSRRGSLQPHNLPYAHDLSPATFLEAIVTIQPHVLIGATGAPGTFTKPVIEAMSRINERPVIFALSKPTDRAECTAEQAYGWRAGRALFASGSPFGQVIYGTQRFRPGQGNDAYIFPGVGIGALVARAKWLPPSALLAAARSLAEQAREGDLAEGTLYPPLSNIREVSLGIAVAVAKAVAEQGLATIELSDHLQADIRSHMYDPTY